MEYGAIKPSDFNEKRGRLIDLLAKIEKEDESDVRHEKADRALLEYINDELIREAFDRIKKWYR